MDKTSTAAGGVKPRVEQMPVAEDILLGSSKETATSKGKMLLECLSLTVVLAFHKTTSLFMLGTDLALSLATSRNQPSAVDN